MIQRIQTVYLAIALILCIVSTIGFFSTESNSSLAYLMPGIMSVDILITIFMYKNRTTQRRLCKIMVILTIAFCAYMAVLGYQTGWDSMPYITIALPLIAAIFTLLASRAIKKDDDLVKSVDRLR